MWTTYLADTHPPVPALALRPIVHSVLLAGPLALGANLTALRVAHVVWVSLVGASGVWVARRSMSGPAAVAFGIAVGWSYAWVLASQQLMSEATACAFVLLAIALYRGVHASHARAVALACVVFVGWLARPNLAVLALAVPIALALELGWRRALRPGPSWTFVLSFGALVGGAILAHWVATGLIPYEQYGVLFEVVDADSVRRYQSDYRGWSALLRERTADVMDSLVTNVWLTAREFTVGGAYLHVGWAAVPALAHTLLWRRAQPERIFAACAAVLLLASALVVTMGFSSLRYPVPSAVCFWFLACASLGDLAQTLRVYLQRAPQPWMRPLGRRAALLPLALLVTLSGFDNWAGWVRTAPSHWRAYRRSLAHPKRSPTELALRAMCRRLDRDAVIAAPDPWQFYLACATATVKIPLDLQDPAWVERYLNEVPLGYVLVDDQAEFQTLRASPRLQRLASRGEIVLYEVVDPLPESRPWKAPPRLPEPARDRKARAGPQTRPPT